jgi:hypothetical protein
MTGEAVSKPANQNFIRTFSELVAATSHPGNSAPRYADVIS